MESSYYQIAQQLTKAERARHLDALFKKDVSDDPRFMDDFFLKVFREMKDKYQVCFKLFGENNFKILVFEYLRNIAYTDVGYGHLFPEFLGNIKAMESLRFVKWIAKLDWFWFADDKRSIQLPKGTLHSWGNLQKDQEDIEIEIDESIMERLVVKKHGKEFHIVID